MRVEGMGTVQALKSIGARWSGGGSFPPGVEIEGGEDGGRDNTCLHCSRMRQLILAVLYTLNQLDFSVLIHISILRNNPVLTEIWSPSSWYLQQKLAIA